MVAGFIVVLIVEQIGVRERKDGLNSTAISVLEINLRIQAQHEMKEKQRRGSNDDGDASGPMP